MQTSCQNRKAPKQRRLETRPGFPYGQTVKVDAAQYFQEQA